MYDAKRQGKLSDLHLSTNLNFIYSNLFYNEVFQCANNDNSQHEYYLI